MPARRTLQLGFGLRVSVWLLSIAVFGGDVRAETITVDTLSDDLSADFDCDDLAEDCSLREAIDDAENGDIIVFSLSLSSTDPTIVLQAPLPALEKENLTLNGLSCTGCTVTPQANTNAPSAGLNTVVGIAIDGSGLTSFGAVPLLSIEDSGITVQGINLRNGPGHGIELNDKADQATIAHCIIGTDRDGAAAAGNQGDGIQIDSATGVTLGPGNLLSGNGSRGIHVSGGSAHNLVIESSIIGLNASGTAALANTFEGVVVEQIATTGISGLLIGGSSPSLGNVISGNGADGIYLGGNISSAVIQNNIVGTNGAGNAALPNGGVGLNMQGNAGGNQKIRTAQVLDNLFSGNTTHGLELTAASENDFFGNYVGTNAAGEDLGNGGHGFHLASNGQN